MFFEKELLSFNIVDVFEMRQKNVNKYNSGRKFNALSYRFNTDAVLETETDTFVMKNGHVSYVPSGVDYTRLANVDEFIVVHFYTTDYNTRRIESFLANDHERLAMLFREIYDCWSRKELGYKYRCSAVFYRILAECYVQNYVDGGGRSKIQDSVDYIQANYKNSGLRISDVAERSFMSEVYFRKLFKAEYGVSPQKYIVDLRIQNAVGLISTGYYTLAEVAYMSGYADYKYFSAEFKRIKGVSPSKYFNDCNET